VEPLDAGIYRDVVRRALAEDLGWGDVTTSAIVPADARAVGVLVFREPGVLAGLDGAIEAFRQLDPSAAIERFRQDGDVCAAGDRVARISGLASALLTAEQTAVGLLGHLSGIATLTRRMVDAAHGHVEIADTRRTLPLLRALEKYAVRAGGGTNGRSALDERLVIKAGHVRMAGGVAAAVSLARREQPGAPVEVEVASRADVETALAAGASVIRMREPRVEDLRAAKSLCEGRARLDVSVRCGVDAVLDAARAGADVVSIGQLIDSAPAVDVALELDRT
jgi:nicotinate-nucleotide pyrophosphorylase (carboxylating)